MGTIKLTIDGRAVEVEAGKTVLEAAKDAGIPIPTICSHPDLPNYGACRMCIVQIEGVRGFPTSCTTPAEAGMKVVTENPELKSLRARVMELMQSGHPNACLKCPHREDCEKYRPHPTKAGKTTRCAFCSNRPNCELRELTLKTLGDELALPTLYRMDKLERDDPFMDRDLNLCILCGRCFRICEKIHGQPAISITHRGRWAKIGTAFDRDYTKSGCAFCGACIDICPTGTLTDRFAKWYGPPDRTELSACVICPEGCSFVAQVAEDRLVANLMPGFERDDRLCAIGRFAYPQIVAAPDRLPRPTMKNERGESIAADWDSTLAHVAKGLATRQGPGFAVIASAADLIENRSMYVKFARDVMGGRAGFVPAGQSLDQLEPADLRAALKDGRIKAAIVAGDFLDEAALKSLEFLVVADFLPSAATERADAVFPVAILSELEGTYRTHGGELKAVKAVTAAPGMARAEWTILRDLAAAMGAEGLDFQSAAELAVREEDLGPAARTAGAPRDRLADLPARFRGHSIADTVCALTAIGLPARPVVEKLIVGGFLVVAKQEVVPNFHLLEIEAPQVARHARPGQFAIVMVKETSERAPFTLVDWDGAKGTITLVVEEVGRSSRELVNLKAGDRVAHVAGPLGLPHAIKPVGTVALGGGCYGIGAIYPLARAFKAAGSKVIVVIEASSPHLLYMEDRLRSVCDELIVATKDGGRGVHGGVQEVFCDLAGREKIDEFVAIGCAFMMKMVADATRELGVPTQVALNPIMVDGTGMCGACRVTVGGKTKFACVDGPSFDAHQVDWDELFARRGAYVKVEIEALPQSQPARPQAEAAGECDGQCHNGG